MRTRLYKTELRGHALEIAVQTASQPFRPAIGSGICSCGKRTEIQIGNTAQVVARSKEQAEDQHRRAFPAVRRTS